MFKNLYLLLFGLLLISGQVVAQADVTGSVKDKDGEPAIAAVVALMQAPGKALVKTAVAGVDGTFTIKMVKNGDYTLQIQVLGFKTYNSKVFSVKGSSVKLDAITLENDVESLEEVVVRAEKPMLQVLADKTVFNVKNTVNATGNSAFELMRKAPGVVVDNDENVIVEGKTGVLFYINGKPSVLRGEDMVNFLKTLQSSDIEAIEIITQPSSRYDAEGNAGIINIKLKRDKSLGTNGTVSAGVSIGEHSNRANSSLSFNTRGKKTSLYGAYNNRVGQTYRFVNFNRQQDNLSSDSRSVTFGNRNSHNMRLGFDYYLNKRSTIGAIVTGNFSNFNNDTDNRTPITPDSSNIVAQVLVAGIDTKNETANTYGNLNYKYEGTKGRMLNIDLDYGQYINTSTNLQPNRYFDGSETQVIGEVINYYETPVNIGIMSGQINYKQPFLKGVLSLGGKYSKVSTNNNFRFFDRIDGTDVLNTDQTNDFYYDEQIVAGYFNYNYKYKKINIQLGVRTEHTLSDGRLESTQANADAQVRRDYMNWFPSGGFTFKANKKNSLAVNYSRRIRRPNYQSLNPFEQKINELTFVKGNPFLQPQYTDNIKLSHTYKYSLTTSLSYSFTSDYSVAITEALSRNRTMVISRNVANQKVISLGVAYPTRLNKWWGLYLSANAYRSIFEPTNESFIGISQDVFNFYAQNTFTLPKGYTAEVSGRFSSPQIWGGAFRTKSMGALNIAFKKRFLNNKLTAKLAFNDVFFTARWFVDGQFPDLSISGGGGRDSRRVNFTLSYNFGRKEIKKARRRKTSIEGEKNRVGN